MSIHFANIFCKLFGTIFHMPFLRKWMEEVRDSSLRWFVNVNLNIYIAHLHLM